MRSTVPYLLREMLVFRPTESSSRIFGDIEIIGGAFLKMRQSRIQNFHVIVNHPDGTPSGPPLSEALRELETAHRKEGHLLN